MTAGVDGVADQVADEMDCPRSSQGDAMYLLTRPEPFVCVWSVPMRKRRGSDWVCEPKIRNLIAELVFSFKQFHSFESFSFSLITPLSFQSMFCSTLRLPTQSPFSLSFTSSLLLLLLCHHPLVCALCFHSFSLPASVLQLDHRLFFRLSGRPVSRSFSRSFRKSTKAFFLSCANFALFVISFPAQRKPVLYHCSVCVQFRPCNRYI